MFIFSSTRFKLFLYFIFIFIFSVAPQNCLFRDGRLNPTECITSYSNVYHFCYNSDGSGCIYYGANTSSTWCAFSAHPPAGFFIHQNDGNVVAYHSGASYWASNTAGASYYFIIQDDGNLLLKTSTGVVRWSCNPNGGGSCPLTPSSTPNICLNFPSSQPSRQPTGQPSAIPSRQPTSRPSSQPISFPSSLPSTQPTNRPTKQPTSRPSMRPSSQPSSRPSTPSSQPSSQPTLVPSSQPSAQPVSFPSNRPTAQPSRKPTALPSRQPSSKPSHVPSSQPSRYPSSNPSHRPSALPTRFPSVSPSTQPSARPSSLPTRRPSSLPSSQPFVLPTVNPTSPPSGFPTGFPSSCPSNQPTTIPSSWPSLSPSARPSRLPTSVPSQMPSSSYPSSFPSGRPSNQPTNSPSSLPSSFPTCFPTGKPTIQPIADPTCLPTSSPSSQPFAKPTFLPTPSPSVVPSSLPTITPTLSPSILPTTIPSIVPTVVPSVVPTALPTVVPTTIPTTFPTFPPTVLPTLLPSLLPSVHPSAQPSSSPVALPSSHPTIHPTKRATEHPTTTSPTFSPSSNPTTVPTEVPSFVPTICPSVEPHSVPSVVPSLEPTAFPSPISPTTIFPSRNPRFSPTLSPSFVPSCIPSASPSRVPTVFSTTQISSMTTINLKLFNAVLPNTIIPSQSLRLEATLTIARGVQGNVTWKLVSSSPSSNINLNSVASTALVQPFVSPITSISSTNTFYLFIPSNVLSPGSYSFQISATLTPPVSNSITISVNSPPSPGLFSISPLSGIEIDQLFDLHCDYWNDDNLPLSFQFSYWSISSNKLIIRSVSVITSVSSQFPAGLREMNYSVQCVADVFDSLGSNTTVSKFIQVVPMKQHQNLTQTANLINRLLNLTSAASADEKMQKAFLAVSLLNRANCSLAPNCSSLNRRTCYHTSHTCGPCLLDLMIGTAGDSNDKCYRFRSEIPSNPTNSLVAKECAGNCSGRGNCQFFSTTTGKTVPICYESDLSCVARCSCDREFEKSINCDISNEEIEQKIRFRDQAVKNILPILSTQNISAESIKSWLGNVRELSQVSNEVSSKSLDNLITISSIALSGVLKENIDSSALVSFPDSLNSLADVFIFRNQITTTSPLEAGNNNGLFLNLMKNYTQYLAANVLPFQMPQKVTKSNFKINVEYLSSSVSNPIETTICSSNASISLPQTALETALKVQPSTITVPTCFNYSNARSGNSQAMSVFTMSSSIFNHPEFTSDPISLFVSSSPCSDSNRCQVKITVPSDYSHMKKKNSSSHFDTNSSSVHCQAGEFRNYTVVCPNDGKAYPVQCTGKEMTLAGHCPYNYSQPICNGLFGGAANDDVHDIGCKVVHWTKTNITCSCPLFFSTTITERRLLGSSTQDKNTTSPTETCEASYVAMLNSITENFLTTVLSARSLDDPEKLSKSWTVIVTLVSLITVVVFALVLANYADQERERKVAVESNMILHAMTVKKNNESSHQKTNSNKIVSAVRSTLLLQPISAIIGLSNNRNKQEIIKQPQVTSAIDNSTIMELAEEALPQILSSNTTFLHRLWTEMKRHHRWLGIIFHFNSKFPRILRVLSLTTNIVIMLFVQSITYSYTHGDDGGCGAIHDHDSCLQPESDYRTKGNKCYWTAVAEDETEDGKCLYIWPENSMTVVLFVAIFSALISAPLAILADWLIQNILAAPTKNEKIHSVKVISPAMDGFSSDNHHNSEVHLTGRQLISFENDVLQQQKIQERVKKEFAELKDQLLLYRTQLQFDYEVKEFNEIWGLNEDGDFYNEEFERSPITPRKPKVEKKVTRPKNSFFFSSMRSMRLTNQRKSRMSFLINTGNKNSVAALIQAEMNSLQVELKKETIRFQARSTKTSSSSNTERMKNKRLLYLFQKDLLPGLEGEILEIKDKRDNNSVIGTPSFFIHGVSLQWKYLTWGFLFLLNGGMIFYVFLFAISQDSHRQAAWGKSFAIWLVFEIVLISTVFCLVIHILLPMILLKNLFQVKKKLMESVQKYQDTIQNSNNNQNRLLQHSNDGNFDERISGESQAEEVLEGKEEKDEEDEEEDDRLHKAPQNRKSEQKRKPSKTLRDESNVSTPTKNYDESAISNSASSVSFNAAKYLFLSYRLSMIYSDLKVAKIILQFETPYPKQSYQYIEDISKKYNKKFAAFIRSGSLVAVFLLTNFLSIPVFFQDIVFQLILVTAIGYYVYIHILLFQTFPLLIILPEFFLVILVLFAYRALKIYWFNEKNLNNRRYDSSPQRKIHERKVHHFSPKVVPIYQSPTALIANTVQGDKRRKTIRKSVPNATEVHDLEENRQQQAQPKQDHVSRRVSVQQGIALLENMQEAIAHPDHALNKSNNHRKRMSLIDTVEEKEHEKFDALEVVEEPGEQKNLADDVHSYDDDHSREEDQGSASDESQSDSGSETLGSDFLDV
jgi:hypothetical protein